ncbi:MAG: S24 family peptidase [Balneolaceae bacterium]
MNQLLERIKKAYSLQTDAEVATFLGMKPTTLSMQKNRGKLDLTRIVNKCNDLNLNWLLNGHGPIRRNQINHISANSIPIYAEPGESDQSVQENREVLRITLMKGESDLLPRGLSFNDLKGYPVSEDSMAPTLTEGDIVIIDTRKTTLEDGAIFLLSFDGTVLCRRIQKKSEAQYFIHSDNPGYDSFEISGQKDNFKIVGKVIFRIHSFNERFIQF